VIYRLANPVRSYPWGSTTAIPELLGLPPTGEPQAELWLGAHPSAPSTVEGDGSLLERIEADPAGELGTAVVAELGPRLPFLLKVLAAAAPLSIQAHPSMAQARAGFAAEDARGVPIDAPHRNYKDASHKPELLCALGPFRALAGFRAVPDTVRLLTGLDVEALAPYLAMLRDQPGPAGLRRVVAAALSAPAAERAALVDAVAAACRAHPGGELAAERRTAAELAERYPGDAGVLVALLLNHVGLAPGEALFLPAGSPHVYLSGTGVEIMASSDNVLRGGLTGKHVDVPELLRVLDCTPGPPRLVASRTAPDGERLYPAPVREFRLTRLALGQIPSTVDGGRPQILLCVEGSVTVSTVDGSAEVLARGESGYLPASEEKVILSGPGVLFRATPNLG
jgi:mannose-6-phosphate isomerase